MYDIENYTHHGLTIRIVPDDDPMSPRDHDNLGHMVCWHPRYNLGDEQVSPRDYYSLDHLIAELTDAHDPTVILPLYLYDHSGITISAGTPVDLDHVFRPDREPYRMDPGGWDTSFVGFVFDTPETRKAMGVKPEDIEEVLRGEVELYATYLEGGYVGFIVEDEDGNHLDSCWGFDDLEFAKSEAEASAKHAAAELAELRAADLVIVRAAQALHADENTRVHTGALIVESDDGYWVAAEVLVPKEKP